MTVAIWDWVVAAYGRPGVPAATLTLQDIHGQNTSYLLWAVHARSTDKDLLVRAAAAARAWDQTALVPLREVRRSLKPPLTPFSDDQREAFREAVKALELASEKLLMETLEGLSHERGDAAVRDVLHAASQAWSRPAPDAALSLLAEALE